MIRTKISEANRARFYMSLYKYCNVVTNKRGITTIINTHSDTVGNITILVTGKRGTAEKHLVIFYDEIAEEWNIFTDGYKYQVLMLSDLTTILKTIVQQLSTLLSKF